MGCQFCCILDTINSTLCCDCNYVRGSIESAITSNNYSIEEIRRLGLTGAFT